jgi:hypothetical protein
MPVVIDQLQVTPETSRAASEAPTASAETPTTPPAPDPEELRRALLRWMERQMRVLSD